MSADAMRRAILMDVENVCTKACVCVFFSLKRLSLILFIYSHCLSDWAPAVIMNSQRS